MADHYSMIHPSTPLCTSSVKNRKSFHSLLFFPPTFRRHCKQYLPGDIQTLMKKQVIKENILVIDLDLEDSKHIFNVDVMQSDGTFSSLHTTIKIARCLETEYLQNVKAFGKIVAATSASGVRKIDGNH